MTAHDSRPPRAACLAPKEMKPNEKIASFTRLYRKMHRWVAVPMFAFMFMVGLTGLLLGWKKNIGLLPPTQKGSSMETKNWIPLDSIYSIAEAFSRDSMLNPSAIERIDIRPAKGTAKIVYADHFHEIQIDCASGKVLSAQRRNSDIIEKIHDGSILDHFFGTSGDPLKLAYTSTLSIGLLLLSFSGFWLWWNPRRIKRNKLSNGK